MAVLILDFDLCLQAGSTGQLSTATAFANFAGCIARIFTSVQEGGGAAMVRGYVLGMSNDFRFKPSNDETVLC